MSPSPFLLLSRFCFFICLFFVIGVSIYLTPLYFRAICGTPVYKCRIPPSSSPQDPVFIATSVSLSAIERVSNPQIETETSLPAIVLDLISDSDALSEVGSVDMDRLELG